MNTSKRCLTLLALAMALTGCDIFQDQTPDFISFRMDGPSGTVVSIVYSTEFIAAVDEIGVTHLELFGADTVTQTLPIDTIVDVRVNRQLYLEALSGPTDTVTVDVEVDVDDRGVFDDSGNLFPGIPWQFLYRYNRPVTQTIEIVL
jgi:hypothetical protein